MGDLASRFKLPVEYTSSIILPQVGSAVPGRLYGQLIFTVAFVSRIRAQVPCPVFSFLLLLHQW